MNAPVEFRMRTLVHLERLETESIEIFREVAAEATSERQGGLTASNAIGAEQ